ncbi:MAG: choice-of-anchor K domain-containing protein [Roseobacter sp.]
MQSVFGKFVGKFMLRSSIMASTLALFLALPAYSATLSGDFSGSVVAPTTFSGDQLVHSGSGTDNFAWGASSGPAETVEDGDASEFLFESSSFNYSAIAPGDYLLGTITWVNESNWHAGGVWESTMTLNLSLDTPEGVVEKSLPISFTIDNTIDLYEDTDLNESTGSIPDVITGLSFAEGAFDLPIDLGGGLLLSDIFFQLDVAGTPGSAWTPEDGFMHNGVASASQFNPATGVWESREGGTSVIGIYGSVSPVPLPAGIWLMISGLGGVFMMRRRKEQNA